MPQPHSAKGCQTCRPGFYGNQIGTRCLLCPRGTYQNEEGARQCKSCADVSDSSEAIQTCMSVVGSAASWDGQNLNTVVPNISNLPSKPTVMHQAPSDDWTKGTMPETTSFIVYGVACALITCVLLAHRNCPRKFKALDLVFAQAHCKFVSLRFCRVTMPADSHGKTPYWHDGTVHHYSHIDIEDSHAVRMYDSRLGAAFTLSLPLFLGIIIVLQFSSSNIDRSQSLLPFSAESVHNQSDGTVACLYNRIEIELNAFAARDVSVAEGPNDESLCSRIKLMSHTNSTEEEDADEELEARCLARANGAADDESTQTSDILCREKSPATSGSWPGEGEKAAEGEKEGTLQTTCTMVYSCKVSSDLSGDEDVLVSFPDEFQTVRWLVSPSTFDGRNTTIKHTLNAASLTADPTVVDVQVDNEVLAGTYDQPTVVSFATTRCKKSDKYDSSLSVSEPNPLSTACPIDSDQLTQMQFGLQLDYQGTHSAEDTRGSYGGEHFVAFRFHVSENVYVVTLKPKLGAFTRLGTILSILLTVVAGLKLTKAFMEKGLDELILRRSRATGRDPPADVVERRQVLVEKNVRAGGRGRVDRGKGASAVVEMTVRGGDNDGGGGGAMNTAAAAGATAAALLARVQQLETENQSIRAEHRATQQQLRELAAQLHGVQYSQRVVVEL